MNRAAVQRQLQLSYEAWRSLLAFTPEEAESLSPPLLLNVTGDYADAEKRVLVVGQETYGWEWTSDLPTRHPAYETDFPFRDLWSMQDFIANDDAVEALCWGYRLFDFASRQPKNRNSAFWQAFREVRNWPSVGVMWTNLSRSDYGSPESESCSILSAPRELQGRLATHGADLISVELAALQPDSCLFFTGPNYDALLNATFPGSKLQPCEGFPLRHVARVVHPNLPAASFRTYHPNYLSRSKQWGYIDALRCLVLGPDAPARSG